MFSAAILSPPFLFVQKFAGPKLCVLKFVRPFVKMSVRPLVLKLAPRSPWTFAPSFVPLFILTLVKSSVQHLALMADRSFPRNQKFLRGLRHRTFSFNRCDPPFRPCPSNP